MLRRLWLVFAQAVTVALAVLFVVQTLRPPWLRQAAPAAPTAGAAAPDQATASAAARKSIDRGEGSNRGERAGQGGQGGFAGSYAEAARRAMPAVVNIYTSKVLRHPKVDDPILRQMLDRYGSEVQRITSLGSGVITTASGYVVTNNHVVEAADEISVALADGRRVDAKLVGADPDTDLAVLRIALPNLPVIAFGQSERLRVGDVVLAIGNPFDVGQTVTMGIVSALGRSNLNINAYEDFIQTDAAINQGNSGGALVDTNGQLVGINTAIYSLRSGGSVGIGFAIPAATIAQVVDQLIQTGHVRRGYFGIEPYDITPEIASAHNLDRSEGVVVNTVIRDAPAGRAGMKPDDVLLSINGDVVTGSRTMLTQIAKLEPGSNAAVRVLRRGREVELKVSVGERPPPDER